MNTVAGEGRPIRTVLVVDNDLLTVECMSLFLRDLGFEVTTATDVASGVETARTVRPDVVLTDIGLPDGSGIDLMKQVLSEIHTVGIALTGHGTDADLQAYREAGFAKSLIKPIDFDDLERLLKSLRVS